LDTKNPDWDAVVSSHILSEVIFIPVKCIQLPVVKIIIFVRKLISRQNWIEPPMMKIW